MKNTSTIRNSILHRAKYSSRWPPKQLSRSVDHLVRPWNHTSPPTPGCSSSSVAHPHSSSPSSTPMTQSITRRACANRSSKERRWTSTAQSRKMRASKMEDSSLTVSFHGVWLCGRHGG
ncbi:hypothetical protein CPC08DRAFT_714093, partial [Agrocybe pediades]